MAFSTPDDVRRFVHTGLLDPALTDMITWTDARINAELGTQTAGAIVNRLSALMTARDVRNRLPQSRGVGEFRENFGDVLEMMEKAIADAMATLTEPLIVASAYQHIDEDERYTEEPG